MIDTDRIGNVVSLSYKKIYDGLYWTVLWSYTVKYKKERRDNESTVELYNVYNIIMRRNLSNTSRKLNNFRIA